MRATARAWARYIPAIPAALTVMAAGWGFQRVFTWADTAGPVTVAALLGAGAGVAARQALTDPGSAGRRQPGSGSSLLAGAALVAGLVASVTVTAAAFASPGAGSAGAALARGVGALAGGWSRILTTSVPVPPTADRLPLAAGLVTIGVAWSVFSASRRQPGVDALLPAGLILLAALLLGVHGPGSLIDVAGPPLVPAAAYLLIVSHPTGESGVWVPPGRTAAAVSTGAVILVIVLAIGSHLPLATLRTPVDLRNSLSPPVNLASTANPLDLLPAWQAARGAVMFTATVDRAWLAAPADWHLVSLDTYDGTGWSSDASATTAGNRLPLPAEVSAAGLGPEVRVEVRRQALAGPWIPTAGVPTGVTPADLEFDARSSDLLATGSTAGPFTLTGRLSELSRSELDAAAVGSGVSAAAQTAVPACFPASLQLLATRATAGLDRPDQQAVAVEQQLATRGGFQLDPRAAPGSSCARLSAFAASRSGTEEQFATAFALMARSIGLPSRLAVGFTPGAIDQSRGETVVTGSDAAVWPEVDLGRLGWVAFDPVPPAEGRGAAPGGAAPATTLPVAQEGLNQVRQTVASSSSRSVPATTLPNPPAPPRTREGSDVGWLLVALLVLAAAGVGGVAARYWARRRRRARRRSAPDPVGRILGAWREVLDTMALLRVPVSSLTPSEVSAVAAELVPPSEEASRQLGVLVDRAVYAGVVDDATVEEAWKWSDSAVRALAEAVPAGRRVRALLVGTRRRADG